MQTRSTTALFLTRPGAAERAITVLTMIVLAIGLPTAWMLEPQAAGDVLAGATDINLRQDPIANVLLAALLGYAIIRLTGNFHFVMELIRREPLLATFVGIMCVSALWSPELFVTVRRAAAITLVLLFGYYLVVRYPLIEIMKLASRAFMFATVLHYAWIFGIPRLGIGGDTGWTGVLINRNTLGENMTLATIVFLITARSHRRYRALYYLFTVLSIILVIGSQSKTSLGAMAGLVVMTGVFVAFRARAQLYGAVALTFITSAVGAVLWTTANLGAITRSLERDITLSGRVPLWEELLPIIWDNPWLGSGYQAFWRGFYSPSHDVLISNTWNPPHAHNALFDYAIELGIPAAMVFVLLFVRTVVRSARFVRYKRGAVGLFPIVMASYTLLFSITENGVVKRNMGFTLLVVAIASVTQTRRPRAQEELEVAPQPVSQPQPS